MSLFLGILLAFLVFLIVVIVHEFGHFFTARLTKMRVEEFGFGIPPRAFSLGKDKKGTEYTWNWLPIGGFVRIFGEDPTGEDAYKAGAFMSRPWIQRVLVLVAGVVMNFVLASVIFTGLFLTGVSPITVNPISSEPTGSYFIPSLDEAIDTGYVKYDGVEISAITGSIASSAGIGTSEKLISVDNISIDTPERFIGRVKEGKELQITTEKDGVRKVTQILPVDGKIGVYVGYHNMAIDPLYFKKLPLLDAAWEGIHETYASSILTLDFVSTMLHGIFTPSSDQEHQEAKSMLSGPIGVGATFVGLVEISAPISLILVVVALISVNLGVINLLPIPALDGGRIVTTTLYSLVVRYFHAGKARFLQIEKYFHAIGFILLMTLTLYVAGLDISRFF